MCPSPLSTPAGNKHKVELELSIVVAEKKDGSKPMLLTFPRIASPNRCTPSLPSSHVAVVEASASDVVAAEDVADCLSPGFLFCWGAGTKM